MLLCNLVSGQGSISIHGVLLCVAMPCCVASVNFKLPWHNAAAF